MLVVAMLIVGCGSSDDGGAFKDCGNGVLDAGEECDDGNLSDNDACLGTCKLNVCGDFFLNVGVEQCEQGILNDQTCTSLGFASGTLACSSHCTFDTSGCTGAIAPTPTPTPVEGGETPSAGATPSGPGASPTAAATPSGAACKAGDQIVVTESVDKSYGGLRVELKYPASVTFPGSGASTDATRVTGTPSGGFVQVVDAPTSGSFDDTLTIAFAGTTEHPAGTFAVVTFDCVEGAAPPAAGDFICTVASASTGGGVPITDEGCAITLQ